MTQRKNISKTAEPNNNHQLWSYPQSKMDQQNRTLVTIANTDSDHTKGALITVFVWPQGTEERELFSTRSNVNSTIIDYEYKGHYIKNYHHKKGVPDPIYKMQRESNNWKKTTSQYKEYQNDLIKENGWE